MNTVFIVKYHKSKYYAGKYISLKVIADLVIQGKRIKVVDQKTKRDVTRETLVACLVPILRRQSNEFLANLVESLR